MVVVWFQDVIFSKEKATSTIKEFNVYMLDYPVVKNYEK